MFSIESRGSFDKTESFLRTIAKIDILDVLAQYAQQGVDALEAATPVNSGLAAHSWGWEVEHKGSFYTIFWTNTDIENGFPVAIMLQYGYATGTGGYVEGQDYINPAIKPIFDQISNEVWKVVTSA